MIVDQNLMDLLFELVAERTDSGGDHEKMYKTLLSQMTKEEVLASVNAATCCDGGIGDKVEFWIKVCDGIEVNPCAELDREQEDAIQRRKECSRLRYS